MTSRADFESEASGFSANIGSGRDHEAAIGFASEALSLASELLDEWEELLEGYRSELSTSWWNCNGGTQMHQDILDEIAKVDAALGRPFSHPNPTHRV